ncbi:MAG TPA: hypothetical protein GXZ43_05885 [Clostridiaceae bacterium]|nr:hypothetical protein [Clostridiaceae bacterium]
MKRKIALILCFVMCLSLLATGCGTKKIDTTDLMDVVEKGFNGSGSVDVEVNPEYAMSLVLSKSGKKKDADILSLLSGDDPVVKYIDSIKLDKVESEGAENGSLSNGDKVVLILKDDPALAKEAKMQIKTNEIVYTMSGLDDAEEYDPFADFTMEFEGDNGEGYFTYDYSWDSPVYVSYEFKDQTGKKVNSYDYFLSNGDKIIVYVDADEEYIASQGYVLTQTEKEYTVSGLTEFEELTEDTVIDAAVFEFTGAAPQADVKVDNNLPADIKDCFYYYVDPSYDVNIGDTITLEVSVYQYSLKEKGYSFPSDEITRDFELTSDMVPRYLSPDDVLTEDQKATILSEIEDAVSSKVATSKSGYKTINDESHEVKGIKERGLDSVYLLYPKESNLKSVYTINALGFIYKFEFEVENGKKIDSYLFVGIEDVIIMLDGTIDLTEASIETSYYFEEKDDLVDEYINANKTEYTITEISYFGGSTDDDAEDTEDTDDQDEDDKDENDKDETDQDENEGEKLVLDSDGIKIYFTEFLPDEFFGPEMHFRVENTTDTKYRVHMDTVKFDNGVEDTFPLFTTELPAKESKENYYAFLYTDLKEEDYTKVKEMEVVFSLLNDDYSLVKTFDPVTVEIPQE